MNITRLQSHIPSSRHRNVVKALHNTEAAVGTTASLNLDAALPYFLIQDDYAEFYEPRYFEVFEGLPRQVVRR